MNMSIAHSIEKAAHHGFMGIDIGPGELAKHDVDIEYLQDKLIGLNITPGYIMLSPIRVPAPDPVWREALNELPLVAKRAEQLGFRRAAIVVLPFHETLPFNAAFDSNVQRVNELMTVLDDHGIALGLEYVSPLTRRAPYPYAFLHDMSGMLSFCAAIKSPNTGLLLDSFHWHCAGEGVAHIESLTPREIIAVHVNDAPRISTELQTVGERALPGTTGVIDITGFMTALKTIGYDGPVTCEPMTSAIKAVGADSDDEVLVAVSASLDLIMPTND